VFRRIGELVQELAGIPRPPTDWNAAAVAAFRAVGAGAGASVTETVLACWEESATGREMLDALAGRLFSSSWHIPDAVMPELLRRLGPEVAELLGGLDRAVVNQATFTLEIVRRGRASC
jgi:hypothetical protein